MVQSPSISRSFLKRGSAVLKLILVLPFTEVEDIAKLLDNVLYTNDSSRPPPSIHQYECKACRQCAQRQGIWKGPWQRYQGSQSRKSRRHRDPGCEVVVQFRSNIVWLPGTSTLGRQSAQSKVCAAACV